MARDSHQLRCYEYVNRPYAAVRDALRANAAEIFQRATTSAAARAESLGAELHAKVGGLELARDVTIRVTSIDDASVYGTPALRLGLEWSAQQSPGLFPTAKLTLTAFALSSSETQLELDGTYEPPLGVVGKAIDAMLLHRIAEASVLRFVQDIALYLRQPAA